MRQSEQKNRRHLTGLNEGPRLAIPERGQDELAREREKLSSLQRNDLQIHSRDVSVSLQLRRTAGVFHGISSETNSGSRQPTRHLARWVFAFPRDVSISDGVEQFVMANGTAACARVPLNEGSES